MQIAVLVKQVPDDLAGARLTAAGTLDRTAGPATTDPVDRNALEAAVALAEAAGDSTVTVVAMGPASAKAVLKECVSVGATAGVHVSDEGLAVCMGASKRQSAKRVDSGSGATTL